jgi:hypothetical protein
MNKAARRLRRLIGFEHEASARFKGGIEAIQPGCLSGWVIAPDLALHEVRLLVGNHLIARSDINQPRPDVCDAHDWKGEPGFKLNLSSELPPIDWQLRPRLIALSPDGSQQIELKWMRYPEQTSAIMLELLRSDLLGLIGHCDGLQHGKIAGWAGRTGQRQPARIWLQTAGKEPQAVSCNQRREGMEGLALPEHCGFSIHPDTLPEDWGGQEVWCSFDRHDRFRLPQPQTIVLPGGDQAERPDFAIHPATSGLNELPASQQGSHQSVALSTPEDLRHHWETVEMFRRYLDSVEEQLNAQERAGSLPVLKRSRRGWWSRLLQSGQ